MELSTPLWGILLIVLLTGVVGVAASVGGILAVRRENNIVRALGAVGIVLGVLLGIYAIMILLGAAV